MKRKTLPSQARVRATLALIFLAIGLVGIMEYSWFRQSAIAEIEGAYRSLNATVLQTLSREFDRYGPLVDDLHTLAAAGAAGGPSVGSALLRIDALYGSTGVLPHLVTLVGVTTLGEPTRTRLPRADGSWASIESPFSCPIPEDAARPGADGSLVVLVCGDGSGERQFILLPLGISSARGVPPGPASAKGLLAVIELDAEGFFETYTRPAVAAVLPGATIEWTRRVAGGALGPDGGPGHGGIQPGRSFNPLLALFGAVPAKDRTFSLVVPAVMDPFMMRGLGRPPAEAAGPDGREKRTSFQVGMGPDPRASLMLRGVTIIVSPISAAGAMETRLARNWLFSVLLLLGLGLAFSLVVLQNHRLGVVQRREREFVATVTHELRTPVTAIRTAADNLRHGIIGPERIGPYGEMIHAQTLRLGSMIEEVLLFSQVEGGSAQPPLFVPLRREELESELLAPLDAIARSEGPRLVFDFGSLPEVFLCDAETLRLALSNLVTNALFHAYPGDDKGEVRVIGKARLPATLMFTVEDDGRGIAKKEAALVFEPFYRDETSRARHEKGSGLGLFIARRRARLSGGDLLLQSPYPRIDGARRAGCRLSLVLPYKEARDVQ